MKYYNSKEWRDYLNDSLDKILSMEKIPFLNISSLLPKEKGIYIISEIEDNVEVILYLSLIHI